MVGPDSSIISRTPRLIRILWNVLYFIGVTIFGGTGWVLVKLTTEEGQVGWSFLLGSENELNILVSRSFGFIWKKIKKKWSWHVEDKFTEGVQKVSLMETPFRRNPVQLVRHPSEKFIFILITLFTYVCERRLLDFRTGDG